MAKKVLHIIHSLDIGGAERLVLNLCKLLKKNGRFTPQVCSLTDGGDLQDEFLNSGIEVFDLNKDEGFSFGLPSKIKAIIEENGIDILHTHNTGPWIYGTLTKMISKVKLVHTEHSNVSVNERRRLLLEKWFSYFTDAIICDSHVVANFMITRQKINPEKVSVIWNGIDVDSFQSHKGVRLKEQAGLGGKFIIGSVARLVPVKDHTTLISAFEIVKKKIPNAHLLLVGDGPLRGELEKIIAQKGFAQDVFITGYLKDVRRFLSLIDVFVLSSLSEGLSLSLIEAMAAEKPIVATAVGGNPEVISHGKTGFLVQPRNPSEIASAILRLATDSSLRHSFGIHGLKTAKEQFDLDMMVQRYQKIYKGLLHKGINQ